MAQNSLINLSF